MNNSKQNITILCISLGSGGAEKVISLLLKSLKNDYNVSLVLFYNTIHFPNTKHGQDHQPWGQQHRHSFWKAHANNIIICM